MMGLITSIFGGRPGMISGATGALAVVMVHLVSEGNVMHDNEVCIMSCLFFFLSLLPQIQKSASGCDEDKNIVTLDMAAVVQKAKEHDKIRAGSGDDLHVMPPSGFVFHESRVGSTLVANSLTAMNAEGHRVYSESDPINEALKACTGILSTCTMDAKIELFRDVGE